MTCVASSLPTLTWTPRQEIPSSISGVAATLKRENVEDTLDAIHGHLRDTLKIETPGNTGAGDV